MNKIKAGVLSLLLTIAFSMGQCDLLDQAEKTLKKAEDAIPDDKESVKTIEELEASGEAYNQPLDGSGQGACLATIIGAGITKCFHTTDKECPNDDFLIFFFPSVSCDDANPLGTCVAKFEKTCVDDVRQFDCEDGGEEHTEGKTCAEVIAVGVCIDTFNGTCFDNISESDCDFPDDFYNGNTCAALNPVGACVDTFFMACTENVHQLNCSNGDVFYSGQICSQVGY